MFLLSIIPCKIDEIEVNPFIKTVMFRTKYSHIPIYFKVQDNP